MLIAVVRADGAVQFANTLENTLWAVSASHA